MSEDPTGLKRRMNKFIYGDFSRKSSLLQQFELCGVVDVTDNTEKYLFPFQKLPRLYEHLDILIARIIRVSEEMGLISTVSV